MAKGLEGLNVVIFESRLSDTMRDLVRLNGGNPILAPSMKEVPIENNPEAFLFAEKLLKSGIDMVIFLTGVGTRALVTALETRYKKEDIVGALKKTAVVPRGPKPIRVLRELGIPFAVTVPEPNTWREILNTMDENSVKIPLKNKVVAVQEYGISNEDLLNGLRERGAKVLRVPVYRWALPDDTEPLKKAVKSITAGEIHVALFTTAVQADHVFKIARELGLENKLKPAFKNMVVASIGPDCSENLKSFGLSVDVEPKSPKMGPLVSETAEKAKKILGSKNKHENH